jgi:hypothetical protein
MRGLIQGGRWGGRGRFAAAVDVGWCWVSVLSGSRARDDVDVPKGFLGRRGRSGRCDGRQTLVPMRSSAGRRMGLRALVIAGFYLYFASTVFCAGVRAWSSLVYTVYASLRTVYLSYNMPRRASRTEDTASASLNLLRSPTHPTTTPPAYPTATGEGASPG